jgi:choline monooxygenase
VKVRRYSVGADVASARVLDPAFYADPAAWAEVRERVFARSWQWLDDLGAVAAPGSLAPRAMLPGLLDEPLLLARDGKGALRCLSNVCTHRGNLLVHADCAADAIRCRYHARRFDLAGRVQSSPGFEGAQGFPAPADDLPQAQLRTWAGLAFAALDPAESWDETFGDAVRTTSALPLGALVRDPGRDRDFEVRAHWALYVENYLEGFHVPYVHPGLAKQIVLPDYRVETFSRSVLQVAHAKGGVPAFAAEACGGERDVAALYWWIFPNLMLNFYPWGLSLNHVQPLGAERTRVVYRGYAWDAAPAQHGAGGALDTVEEEDEAIVEAVQRGVRSRLYRAGRYSVRHERGVHHFHRLLLAALGERA